jgi:predicted esterase YcpF (UPF0227 family)
MILYVHGFRSTDKAPKAQILQQHFDKRITLATFSQEPNKAISDLEKQIESLRVDGIIGSSLGGFYAIYLAEKYRLRTVLINPSTRPYETTFRYLGTNTRDDGTSFIWRRKEIDALRHYAVENPSEGTYMLMLKEGDAVLDYRVAQAYLSAEQLVIESGGSHAFENIEDHLESMERFLIG